MRWVFYYRSMGVLMPRRMPPAYGPVTVRSGGSSSSSIFCRRIDKGRVVLMPVCVPSKRLPQAVVQTRPHLRGVAEVRAITALEHRAAIQQKRVAVVCLLWATNGVRGMVGACRSSPERPPLPGGGFAPHAGRASWQ